LFHIQTADLPGIAMPAGGAMPRKRLAVSVDLPRRLVRLIQAARTAKSDAERHDPEAVALALEAFGSLASWAIPVHGLFVPSNNDVCAAVERVAQAHLGLEHARRELRKSLRVIEAFEQRDPIESAYTQVRTVYDEAYFYAGLAFGITLTDCS
jgi:hypothetical protein